MWTDPRVRILETCFFRKYLNDIVLVCVCAVEVKGDYWFSLIKDNVCFVSIGCDGDSREGKRS